MPWPRSCSKTLSRLSSMISMALFSCVLSIPHARAELAVTGGVGGAVATFVKGETILKATGYAYGFGLHWSPEWKNKPLYFSLGLVGKQTKLGYPENAINKRATLNTVGPALGVYLPISELFMVQIFAQYYPGAGLSTLSTNSVRLNGSNFKYATYETYSGAGAFEGRINFTHDKIDGQFNKKNSFRSGIGISYMQESFFKNRTEITTSKDALTPTTTVTTDELKYQLQIMTVEFFLGLTF